MSPRGSPLPSPCYPAPLIPSSSPHPHPERCFAVVAVAHARAVGRGDGGGDVRSLSHEAGTTLWRRRPPGVLKMSSVECEL